MPVRMIAFDFDGTILLPDHTLGERTASAIRAAQDAGIVIVPASGRRFGSMTQFMRRWDHRGPAIVCNGAEVWDTPSESILLARHVPLGDCEAIAAFCKERDYYLQIYVDGECFFERRAPFSDLYARESGPGSPIGDLAGFFRESGKDSAKLLIIETDPGRMARIHGQMRAFCGDRLKIVFSKPHYLEIIHPEAGKENALRAISERYRVSPEEIMAFGDADNDAGMLAFSGMSVAVENAIPSVKAAAWRVCPPNAEEGVAQAIERWVL